MHQQKKRVTVKEIQQLTGFMNFLSQALPAGRPFIAELYQLSSPPVGVSKVANTHHHRHINQKTVGDLLMFREFLQESASDFVKTVPFLIRREIFTEQMELYSDAAGHSENFFSCVFMSEWAIGAWSDTNVF